MYVDSTRVIETLVFFKAKTSVLYGVIYFGLKINFWYFNFISLV